VLPGLRRQVPRVLGVAAVMVEQAQPFLPL